MFQILVVSTNFYLGVTPSRWCHHNLKALPRMVSSSLSELVLGEAITLFLAAFLHHAIIGCF